MSENKKAPTGAEFNRKLMHFLADREEKEVTLFIPAGVISGTLKTLEVEPTIAELSNANLLSGNQVIPAEETTILIEQIYGWGVFNLPSASRTFQA